MKFIDLFSGIGGFHKGLLNAGGFKCVFASEINTELQKLYYRNFGIKPAGDIRKVPVTDIPKHDILCAGFPCQPFSLAGKKTGYKCPNDGKLIMDILRVIKHHLPSVLILENVPNILNIEDGKFWKFINSSLNKLSYNIIYKIISPVDIGIPQNRKRVFILGFKNKNHLMGFQWPNKEKSVQKLSTILTSSDGHKKIELEKKNQIQHWQTLLSNCKMNYLSSISIVAPEMGATYPLNFKHLKLKDMCEYKGAYGQKLNSSLSWEDLYMNLPSYSRKMHEVPNWLKDSIIYTRRLYQQNKQFLNQWIKGINKTYNSWQILEWRGVGNQLSLAEHILQFRASGIRVLKPHKIPSLVSMTPTQIPIIGREMRYISKLEAAKLQNLHSLTYIPKNNTLAFKAFGNAVNAKVVELIGQAIRQVYYNNK